MENRSKDGNRDAGKTASFLLRLAFPLLLTSGAEDDMLMSHAWRMTLEI
jgi:hypothetical protein